MYRFSRIHIIFEWRLHNLNTRIHHFFVLHAQGFRISICVDVLYLKYRLYTWIDKYEICIDENEQLSHHKTNKHIHHHSLAAHTHIHSHAHIILTSFEIKQQQQNIHHQSDPMHVLFDEYTNITSAATNSTRNEQPKMCSQPCIIVVVFFCLLSQNLVHTSLPSTRWEFKWTDWYYFNCFASMR